MARMHKQITDMADEIFAINAGGHVSTNTRSEIEYATAIENGACMNIFRKYLSKHYPEGEAFCVTTVLLFASLKFLKLTVHQRVNKL